MARTGTTAESMTSGEINNLLGRARMDFQPIQLRTRIKRALLRLVAGDMTERNYTGTMLTAPYDQSPLAIRVVIGQMADAVQFYASRFASNPPTVEVMPLTPTDKVTEKLDKLAGKQELFDAVLLDSMGIGSEKRRNQRKAAMAQAISDVAYYVLTPRDMTFGIPSRDYYSDEEVDVIRAAGKRTGPIKLPKGWPEHADDWRERKEKRNRERAHSALDYFDLQVYPRDMVVKARDNDGIKWAAVIKEIPAGDCGPGTELARSWVRQHMGKTVNGRQVTADDWNLWGLWKDASGRIVGGLEEGGPPSERKWSRAGSWTLIQFFNRVEMVYLISSGAALDGGQEIYRCEHGATDQGAPVVPVFEVPAVRSDIETLGGEFLGPMSQIWTLGPIIDQLMTQLSAVAMWNSAPRFYCVLPDGSVLRDDDGEPKFFDSAPVPGADPTQIGAYPGEIKPLTIEVDSLLQLLPIYLELLANAMPNKAATGDAGSSSAAWLAQQNIQQSNLTIEEPVENHREAVASILRVCHDYLRKNFDTPLYFFQIPGSSSEERTGRGIVEFDPADLTDSFAIQQALETADQRTVTLQIGNELAALGRIDDRTYYQEYMKVRDAREAIIKADQQKLVNAWKYGPEAAGIAPDSGMYQFLQLLIGNVQYQMMQINPGTALAQARQMAQDAQMQAQQAMLPPGGEGGGQSQGGAPQGTPMEGSGNVAQAAGVRRPGMGMATSLSGQLGDRTQPPGMRGVV